MKKPMRVVVGTRWERTVERITYQGKLTKRGIFSETLSYVLSCGHTVGMSSYNKNLSKMYCSECAEEDSVIVVIDEVTR